MTTVTLGERLDALDILDRWIHENEDAVAAAEGELPQFLVELLDQAEGDFKEKARRVARYALGLDAEIEIIGDEIARLQQRQRVRQNAAKRLRERLRQQMVAAGMHDASDPLVTVRLQQGPPHVELRATEFELQALHEMIALHNRAGGEEQRQLVRCVPAKYEPDKRAILAAHRAGEPIPAAFAVVPGDAQLRIR
jgi:hypothetical protein